MRCPRHLLALLLAVLLVAACAVNGSLAPIASDRSGERATGYATAGVSATPRPDSHPVVTSVPVQDTAVFAPTITPASPVATVVAPTATESPVPTATAPHTATPSPTVTASPTPTLGPTPDGVARTIRVPILMYHYVSAPPPGADIYRRDLSVSPAQFEDHLRYLQEAGYHCITLDDLLYALVQGRSLPEKPFILTFDDGYADNYTNAFPLLSRYGMVASFFIITDFVNQGRAEYMTWPQIEEMAAAGQRFGSHSRDHPDLEGQAIDYLVWQALGSKEAIEEHLGNHPRWIAYPSGGYDAEAIAVFESAGYWGGLTTLQGATHKSDAVFELRRVRVRGSHSAKDLGALLALEW